MNTAMASSALLIGPIPMVSPATKTAQPVMGTRMLTGAEVESQM